jgi:hypothetical protein
MIVNISNSILTQYNSANLSYLDKSKSVNQTANISIGSEVLSTADPVVSKTGELDQVGVSDDGLTDAMRAGLDQAYADPGYASRSVAQSLVCSMTYCGPLPRTEADFALWKRNAAIFNAEGEKEFNDKKELHANMKANGASDADIYKEFLKMDKKIYDFNRKLNGHI